MARPDLDPCWLIAVLGAGLWLAPPGSCRAAPSANAAVDVPLVLTCALERPIVQPGETVIARAWVTTASGAAPPREPPMRWSASVGAIAGGNSARWDLPPDALGPSKEPREATAKVVIAVAVGKEVSCLLALQIAKPAPRDRAREDVRGILSGRALLLPTVSSPEEDDDRAGYGLYSYLLIDSQPRELLEIKRCASAIESYLREVRAIREIENYRPRSELNLVLIPVTRNVPLADDPDDKQLPETAAALLKVYDYARAKALLDRLGDGKYTGGPYLVATKDRSTDAHRSVVLLEMTRASPALIFEWVRTFCWLVEQERSWTERAVRALALNMRNVVSITSRRIPEMFERVPGVVGLTCGS